MHHTMKQGYAANSKPDLDKMTQFLAQHERAAKFGVVGWALFFIWVGIA